MGESEDENETTVEEKQNQSSKTTIKYRVRSRKRRRISSDSSTDCLPQNILEVEKNLQASALKNNLDDASVKKILKKVVTNDHVLALVKLREEEEGSSTDEDVSTLTRSKAKTVKKIPLVTAPWNLQLSPIEHIPVKTRPEVEALIAQELPEDEDDEEYEPPNEDLLSDDEHLLESCSDLDSQPRTPATPRSQKKSSPKMIRDGPFVVPQETVLEARGKLNMEKEEATIALRTRSKLSLSATPIEHIESSFVPPDDVPMPDVDEIWNEFLMECLDPTSTSKNEDDDEADPEYNVAADPDAIEDEEGLESSITKVSKKELQDILTELCQMMPKPSPDGLDDVTRTEENLSTAKINSSQNYISGVATHWEGKQEPVSEEEHSGPLTAQKIFDRLSMGRVSIGKSEPPDDDESEQQNQTILINTPDLDEDKPIKTDGIPAVVRRVADGSGDVLYVEVDHNSKFLPNQLQLLQQQLRQHVQLAASNYMQLCVHPQHWPRAAIYKEYLETLKRIGTTNRSSVVNVCNLIPAHELITTWENSVTELTSENELMVQFIAEEMEKIKRRSSNKYTYSGKFPELFKKVIANSSVFLYPYLLPPVPYRPESVRRRTSYLRSEDELIALGLDQFWWYVENNPDQFRRPAQTNARHRWGLRASMELLTKYMMPWTTTKTISSHITSVRSVKDKNNPIFKFLKDRTVEPVRHKLLPFNPSITLYEQPEHEMPRTWARYLAKTCKRFRSYVYRRTHLTGVPPAGVDVDTNKDIVPLEKTPLPGDFTNNLSLRKPNNTDDGPNISIQYGTQATTAEMAASNVFSVVQTQQGMVLVPVQVTNTVNSNSTPICTPAELKPKNTITIDTGKILTNVEKSKTNEDTNRKIITIDAGNIITNVNRREEINAPSENGGGNETNATKVKESNRIHCKCCVLLRKISGRQTVITEYFKCNSKVKMRHKCACSDIVYPRLSNKLRILLKSYWNHSKYLYNDIKQKLNNDEGFYNKDGGGSVSDINDTKDNAFVLAFLIKITSRMNMMRTHRVKKAFHQLLSKFSVDSGDPIELAINLEKLDEDGDIDLHKEFVSFLTAEQAEKLDRFNDYFIGNCLEDLIKKIKEHVKDQSKCIAIVQKLNTLFMEARTSSCDLCSELLLCLWDHPMLARYVFHLFPHRRKHMDDKKQCSISRTEEEPMECGTPVEARETCKQRTAEGAENCDRITAESEEICDQDTAERENCDGEKVAGEENCEERTAEALETCDQRIDEDHSSSDEYDALTINETEDTEREEESAGEGAAEEESVDEDLEESPRYEVADMNEDSNSMTIIKEEGVDTYEITITDTVVQRPGASTSQTPLKGNITKDWKREEDKLILEVLKQSLSWAEIRDTPIGGILEEKQILQKICEDMRNKSADEIKERALYLLQFLIVNIN